MVRNNQFYPDLPSKELVKLHSGCGAWTLIHSNKGVP